MTLNKKDFFFLFGLLISVFIFYPELFFAKAASLIADHWEQHFPWAYLMDESIRHGSLPFWTPFIHCGFPIAAEGQIGVFYLPNLLLYFLLPFQWAYSYMNVVHFLIAACGTYVYAREIKLMRLSSFIAAFIFTLGTAYGGAYYNLTSLKTICWFPVCLFLFEKYLNTQKIRNILILAVVLSQLLTAGYLQVAFLLFLVLGLYVLLRTFFFSDLRQNLAAHLKILIIFSLGVLLAALLSLPQIYLTFELALQSNRIGLTEDYTYIGSMSPLAISTFLVAIAQGFCRGNSIYGGVFSVILILFAVLSKEVRQKKMVKLWLWVGAISLLLALGRWSPLYVAVIKLTHFYSFRTPMKFLVFICFAFAILSGFGFDEALKTRTKPNPALTSAVTRFYLTLVSFFAAVFAAIYLFLTVFRLNTVNLGKWVIEKFIYGHIGRPHTLEEYYRKLNAFLDLFLSVYSFHWFWSVWTIVVVLISVLLVLFLKFEGKFRSIWLGIGFIFLFCDLYTFAWFDIKKDFNAYSAVAIPSPMISRLIEEKKIGHLERLYGFRQSNEELPLVPSANILYGIEDIGAYSPFILKRYDQTIGTFGNVNDSNAAFSPTPQYVLERLQLLSALGVSHILSKTQLNDSKLKLLAYDKASESYLYQNEQEHSKFFFTTHLETYESWDQLKSKLLEANFHPKKTLLLEQLELRKLNLSNLNLLNKTVRADIQHKKQGSDQDVWEIETDHAGFFVVMDSMYPGWTATLNGIRMPILYAYGLFKAIWLEKPGKYEVEFRYFPFDRRLDRT